MKTHAYVQIVTQGATECADANAGVGDIPVAAGKLGFQLLQLVVECTLLSFKLAKGLTDTQVLVIQSLESFLYDGDF